MQNKFDPFPKTNFVGVFLRTLLYLLSITLILALVSSCKQVEVLDTNNQKINQNTNAAVIPPAVNGVMMQGFYWESPRNTPGVGSFYQVLASQAASLKTAGITAMWLPPAYKGSSADDVGYGVYDRYDLGEFNQKGTVATKYGTIAQMDGAITALHNNGIAVYEDIVMNHLVFADRQETRNGQQVWTAFDYTPRNNTHSSFKWNASLMNGWQGSAGWVQWDAWDFQPYNNGDAYDNLLGCEIKYNPINGSAATETINWGNWITTRMKLDGYRLDATKHIWTPFVNSWLDNVKGTRFAVSEAWMRNKDELNAYAGATGGRTSLFDVPLHYTFVDMSGGNGNWDMRGLQDAGFTPMNPTLSVTFVDNHDTEHSTGALYSPVVNFKMFAYAYILTREQGYPCVFYKDYYVYNLKGEIDKLMQIRRENGFGGGFEYRGAGENDADVYMYSRAGNTSNPGLLLMLNDGSSSRSKTINTPFRNATLTDKTGRTPGTVTTDANGRGTFTVNARNYAVWVPTTGGGGGNPPTVPGTNFVVNFKKPAAWGTNIRVYFWNQVPVQTSYPAWPGTAMTSIGNSWYSYTFSGVTSTSIIFNDGTNQTADLTRSSTGWYSGTTWTATNPDAGVNAAPTLSVNPAAGTFTSAQNVTLSSTDDSGIAPTIYYTTDGSTPTTASLSATGSKAFSFGSTTTLKAFAVDNLGLASAVNTYTYTINIPVNTAPVLAVNPAAGTYTSTQTVTLSATDNSGIAPTIYYTTDGSTPTTSSLSASGSKVFTVSATTTIKAFAVDNLGLASAVATYLYTINVATGTTAVTFNINYSNTVNGQDVYIVGSSAQLGAWNTANAIKLTGNPWPNWTRTINLTSGTSVSYKYIRKDAAGNVLWEGGANRTFTPTGASQTRTDIWQ